MHFYNIKWYLWYVLGPLCNSFALEKSERDTYVKLCSLLSDSEPHNSNTQFKQGAHLPSWLENLDPHSGGLMP